MLWVISIVSPDSIARPKSAFGLVFGSNVIGEIICPWIICYTHPSVREGDAKVRERLWDLISFNFHRVKRSRLSHRQMTSETLRYAGDSSFRGGVLISLDCSWWWFQTFKSFAANVSGWKKNRPWYEVLIITVDNWSCSWYPSMFTIA